MAVNKIKVIQENGQSQEDVIMATYLGDENGNYSYSGLNKYIDDRLKDVVGEISNIAGPMVFKGTLKNGDTLPTNPIVGWTYRVVSSGIWADQQCEPNDMITCVATNPVAWTVYQSNIDGAVTGPALAVAGNIPIFDGTTGKIIKDSEKSLSDIFPLRMPINPSQEEIKTMPNGAFYLVY